MKKKIIIICIAILITALVTTIILNFNNIFYKATNLEKTENVELFATINDTVTADSTWCGIFQLVWNDIKNDLANGQIHSSTPNTTVENLNQEDFTKDMISDEYYYQIYGEKSPELKEIIEQAIMEKFNQTSSILDTIDWSKSENIIFYAMLYRKFEFYNKFDNLENDTFSNKYENIEYFGIDESSNNDLGNQVDVLFYNSQNSFAFLINTKTDDEVIIYKNPKGETFKQMYDNMNKQAEKYNGDKIFNDVDQLKIPKINIDLEKDYSELTNKIFTTNNIEHSQFKIENALQSIKFNLDEEGGEIKSDVIFDTNWYTSGINQEKEKKEPRYFYVDDTFVIFLREKGKELPYFAGRIDNITKFQ